MSLKHGTRTASTNTKHNFKLTVVKCLGALRKLKSSKHQRVLIFFHADNACRLLTELQ